MSVYLDYNATAKLRPQAMEATLAALRLAANPSSVHAAGRAARSQVEQARGQVAALVGAKPEAVTFTSGGAEANALAVDSAVQAKIERIILGATEHDTVRENARASGLPVEIWPVDADGVADLQWLADHLAVGGKTLVCLMLANNETGVIQPVTAAAALVAGAGGWLHVDAVQAAGKIAIDLATQDADTLSLSGHKLGGPQGVGALVAGPRARIVRRLHGGVQEHGARAGTENVPGIAGLRAQPPPLFRETTTASWPISPPGSRRLGGPRDGCRGRHPGRRRGAAFTDAVLRHAGIFLRSTGHGAGSCRGHDQRRRRLLRRQGHQKPCGRSHGKS